MHKPLHLYLFAFPIALLAGTSSLPSPSGGRGSISDDALQRACVVSREVGKWEIAHHEITIPTKQRITWHETSPAISAVKSLQSQTSNVTRMDECSGRRNSNRLVRAAALSGHREEIVVMKMLRVFDGYVRFGSLELGNRTGIMCGGRTYWWVAAVNEITLASKKGVARFLGLTSPNLPYYNQTTCGIIRPFEV